MNHESIAQYNMNKYDIERKIRSHKQINFFQNFLKNMEPNGVENLFKTIDEWFSNELTNVCLTQSQLTDLQDLQMHFNFMNYMSSMISWWSVLYSKHSTNPFLQNIIGLLN